MTILGKLKRAAGAIAGKSTPRILTVKEAYYLTPNMIRVVFAGPELEGFPVGKEGGNCKLLIPEVGEDRDAFIARLQDGQKPVRRTYFLGFAGPSAPKVTEFRADWYLVAADPSAIPVAAATLEAMPRDATGVAIFEITSMDDQQDIDMPDGIEAHWLVHPDPHQHSQAQEELIRSLDWPSGRVQTCIAGESGVIRSLRAFLANEKQVPREDTYISGYWKIGLIEDQHQEAKRAGEA